METILRFQLSFSKAMTIKEPKQTLSSAQGLSNFTKPDTHSGPGSKDLRSFLLGLALYIHDIYEP